MTELVRDPNDYTPIELLKVSRSLIKSGKLGEAFFYLNIAQHAWGLIRSREDLVRLTQLDPSCIERKVEEADFLMNNVTQGIYLGEREKLSVIRVDFFPPSAIIEGSEEFKRFLGLTRRFGTQYAMPCDPDRYSDNPD
ncbi:hypothetical protein J4458_05575 [Candidatus Woesearchaeota archaeon]|nr:hypothetical protein [Candidatus Woesearchaeota archaeon]